MRTISLTEYQQEEIKALLEEGLSPLKISNLIGEDYQKVLRFSKRVKNDLSVKENIVKIKYIESRNDLLKIMTGWLNLLINEYRNTPNIIIKVNPKTGKKTEVRNYSAKNARAREINNVFKRFTEMFKN